MEYTEIRKILEEEYNKKPIDTNYNFISRFAKAIHDNIPKVKVCNHQWKITNHGYTRDCKICGEKR